MNFTILCEHVPVHECIFVYACGYGCVRDIIYLYISVLYIVATLVVCISYIM